MLIFKKIEEIREFIALQKKHDKTIGFVPTMGALHRGHLSLIERSNRESTVTVCSIFVNPTQFNDKRDLEKYPRPVEKDTLMLEEAGCDVLFMPEVEEMYPEFGSKFEVHSSKKYSFKIISVEEAAKIALGTLDKTMEGAQRPGHFKGVVMVVSRLFDIIEPHKAYFGEKDFQQLAIITEMVKQLHYPVTIVPCEIIREPDGLAMSSRNVRLSAEERKLAPVIFQALVAARDLADTASLDTIKTKVAQVITALPQLQLEYFEIVNNETLQPVNNREDIAACRGCIAVKLGEVRLIDNIALRPTRFFI